MDMLSSYSGFVEEFDLFNRFLDETRHTGLGPDERRDPDVERLLEAIAFFSAQTRLTAERAIRNEFRSLFHSYLDFLLRPLPAVGLIQAIPGELDDPTAIPAGAEVQIRARAGAPAGAFRTTATIDLFRLDKEARAEYLPETGAFVLRFHGSKAPSVLSLFVHRPASRSTESLRDSLLVHSAIQRRAALVSALVSAVFVRRGERSQPEPCEVDFGRRRSGSDRLTIDPGPALEQVRRFFHFPEEWLFMNVELPRSTPGWDALELHIATDHWHDAPRMSADDFHLHVVPVENIQRAWAMPIEHRGLRSRYPVLHPEPARGFELHTLRGVYRDTPEGRLPMTAHMLHGDGDCYSIEPAEDSGRRSHLAIDAVDAFDQPVQVSIDATWHQPGFSIVDSGDTIVETPGRDAGRVRWKPMVSVRPHSASSLLKQSSELAQLVWLKMKPVLDRDGVVKLLRALGSFEQSVFQPMEDYIVELRHTPAPSTDEHTVVVFRYQLLLGDYPDQARALAYRLSEQIWDLIAHWTAEGLTELNVEAANGEAWSLTAPVPEEGAERETHG